MENVWTGVELVEMRWGLTTYRDCFVGGDIVTWLMNQTGLSTRYRACRLAKYMMEQNFYRHVGNYKDFVEENIYQFTDPQFLDPYELKLLDQAFKDQTYGIKARKIKNQNQEKNSFTGEEVIQFLLLNYSLNDNERMRRRAILVAKAVMKYGTFTSESGDEFSDRMNACYHLRPSNLLISPLAKNRLRQSSLRMVNKKKTSLNSNFGKPKQTRSLTKLPPGATLKFVKEHKQYVGSGKINQFRI